MSKLEGIKKCIACNSTEGAMLFVCEGCVQKYKNFKSVYEADSKHIIKLEAERDALQKRVDNGVILRTRLQNTIIEIEGERDKYKLAVEELLEWLKLKSNTKTLRKARAILKDSLKYSEALEAADE